MKINTAFLFPLLIIALLSTFSCKKAELLDPFCNGSMPTYDLEIKAIIALNCMGSFCHNKGANRGDFTTYAGLATVLASGVFEKRVLTDQDMPKGNGKTLTQNEIDQLRCWTDNNFPEN